MSVDINVVVRLDVCIQRLWHLQADEVSRMMELPLFGDSAIGSSLTESDRIEFKRVLESLSAVNESLSVFKTMSEYLHGQMTSDDDIEYLALQEDMFGSLTLHSVSRI